MNVERLKEALEKAGFKSMSDDELKAWLRKANEYHESQEGKHQRDEAEYVMNYYIDNIAKYKFTEGMGEISGFGGYYEKACQIMLDAGLQWFDSHPNADPKFKGVANVFGIILEDNEDAKALSRVVIHAIPDCSGAMHQATISAILWIRKNGWEKYIEAMSRKNDEPEEKK